MKKPISGKILTYAFAFLVIQNLGACSKSSSKSPVGNVVSGTAHGFSDGRGVAGHHDGAPADCQNSITVDNNGGDLSALNGHFELDRIQMYDIETTTSNSFSASAIAADGFRASVDCQGVRDVTTDNYDRTWTDQDGTHEDSKSSSSDMHGSFQAGEVVNLGGPISPTQRKISFSFKNGHLISATSEVVPTEGVSSEALKIIPKGPISLGNGNSITINAAPLDQNSFEIKIKIESSTEGQLTLQQYGRAVFIRK